MISNEIKTKCCLLYRTDVMCNLNLYLANIMAPLRGNNPFQIHSFTEKIQNLHQDTDKTLISYLTIPETTLQCVN